MTPTKTDAAGTGQAISRQFPEEWPAVPFWSVYHRVKRASTGREELLSVYRDHGVVRKSDRDDNFNEPSEDLSLYQLVHSGDLVINKMKAWQGSVAVSPLDGIVSPAYFVFERASPSDPRYMHYLLRSAPFVAAYRAASKGIRPNQWDLDPDVLRTFPLCLPPLDIQRRIGVSLDRETAEIDAFIRDQKELIGLLEERRAATISHAVTEGLDSGAPLMPSGVGWLGNVPASWNIGQLKHVGSLTLGKMLQESSGDALDVRTNYLRAANVQPAGELVTSLSKSMWFSQRELARLTLLAGDVVIVEGGVGGYGRAALLREPLHGWGFQNSIVRLRPAPGRFDGGFITYLLLHLRHIGYIEMSASVTSMPHFTLEKVAQTIIAWPDIAEQQLIRAHLDKETREIGAAIADAKNSISLSQERRSALITLAVTGKIDVRQSVGV